ncbi:MAG: MFS transporter [Hyphomonadaceae bacterium]|nr:MFS transporter [Hyphomonadaceae bacterium]
MSPAPASPRGMHGILFAALLIIGVGNSMLQPVLPPLARELGLPDASIGFIFSLSALFWVVASPFWGRRSDRVGRRPIVALGMAAYCVSMGLIALVVVVARAGWLAPIAVFIGLMLARAIFGAVGSATGPAAQAYIADRCEPSELIERLAALNAAFALGAAVGPALCALIAGKFGLVVPIALTAVAAGIAAWLVWKQLPEPEKPAAVERADSGAAQWALATSATFLPYLLFGLGLSIVAGTLQQTFTLFLMDRLHVAGAQAAEQAAAGFIATAVALLATQILILPRLKLRAQPLMLIGVGLLVVGLGVQAAAFDLTWLVACCVVQGVGFGLARAGFAGGAMGVTGDDRGAASGLIVSANGAGFIFSPITGGMAYDFIHPLAPLAICGVVLAAMAAHVYLTRAR